MPSLEKIVIIGSGNLGTHLGRALKKAGYPVLQVFSRIESRAAELAKELDCNYTDDLGSINPNGEIYFLAIKDDAITGLSASLQLQHKIVVHSSGSVAMDVLKDISDQYGVFYPLQTFTRTRPVEWKKIPVFVEGSDTSVTDVLMRIAGHIAGKVYDLDSDDRRQIHLAAVFVNNFTNHILMQAEKIALQKELPFDIFQPLAFETLQKAFDIGPSKAQTGPAVRGDEKVIAKHLDLLNEYPELKKIYETMTASIRQAL